MSFSTGLSLNYTINDIIALNLGITQGITYDPGYKKYDDAFYFSEDASFGIPITLAKTDNFGNISWKPSISVTHYWDSDGINIANEDLIDTDIKIGHSFSFGRTNWIGNFREGFSFSIDQDFSQQTHVNKFSTKSSISAAFYSAFEYIGINTRMYAFQDNNNTSEVGGYIRGVQDNKIDTDSAFIFNIDFPIKVWQTDWVGYGLWNWTELFDVELQVSPFIDIAIGNNHHPDANSSYEFKDGWYAAGIELLGFLNKSRSVVGRISVGVDLVQVADEIGKKIDFVDKVVNKLFNTSWRDGRWYDFSLGIGLFY